MSRPSLALSAIALWFGACTASPPMLGWPSDRQPITAAEREQAAPPFLPGEVLTYRALLAGIPAGQCEIRLHETGDHRELLISYEARSNPLVDLIYKVRDKAIVFTDPGDYRPRRMVMERENDPRATVDFDREERIAILTRETTDGAKHFFLNTEDPRDPLSLLYYLRTLSSAPEEEVWLEMVTTTGRTPMRCRDDGPDDVTVAGVPYKAERLVLETLRRPVGTPEESAIKTGEIVVWRNRGNGHALLRGERQTPFGRLVIELVAVRLEDRDDFGPDRPPGLVASRSE